MKPAAEAKPDLSDRLLAALLAPVAFNLCVLILYALFFRVATPVELVSGPLVIVLIAVPAAVGFAAGTDGFVRFLGHSFYTHEETERELRLTAAIWVVIIILTWLLSLAAG